ncbi:MAG: prepilin-type N-terminal cleavage/methylation domain-containing protein [Candidatus Omnitrophota bacterium]|jgi:general secretion pathway protein G
MYAKQKLSRGFTLVEIIVVISVIAILAGVITPNAYRAIEKAKISRATQEVRAIKTASIAFFNDLGLWPGSQWGVMPANPATGYEDDPYSKAPYGEGFCTPPIVHSGCAERQLIGNNAIAFWQGPYLDKWSISPWGWPYMWDANNFDTTGNGIPNEHVVWFDLAEHPGPYDTNPKIPSASRDKLDSILDGGNGLSTGLLQEMADVAPYGTSVCIVVFEGY